jgi:hypothetical protein
MVGPDPKNAFTKALLLGLRELGYVCGQHFVTEPRGAEGKRDAYPGLVADLIRLQVDVKQLVPTAAPVAVLWDLLQRDKDSGSSCRSRCACRPRG